MGDAEAAPANRSGALAAEAARVRRLPAAEQGTKKEWMRRIRDEFLLDKRREVADAGAKECHTGACDSKAQAAGALIDRGGAGCGAKRTNDGRRDAGAVDEAGRKRKRRRLERRARARGGEAEA